MKINFILIYISLFLFPEFVALSQTSFAKMALIASGEFSMGKNSDRNLDFSPAHRVIVDSFYIDKYEVTNAEYLKFCDETGNRLPEYWNMEIFRSGEKFPELPVIGITWIDAAKYADWSGKRLPTEAEWEYAARGGLKEKEYPNGDNWDRERKTNTPGNWVNQISEVKTFPPNAYGIYHMDGNVWEWINDNYSENYYQNSPVNNPKGPSTGTIKVIRSGSWHSGAMCKKVYYRKGLPGSWVDFGVGFRCAKDIK
ncbi:MAG: formylglycine-generating enzyme family protein [Mariniphaga sp.]|nr:formylglycine-generating enzyme family protein [Mariniphaga sp.]